MIIGVISDTHGLLRLEAMVALRGSEHIIHAGDIGSPQIITRLEHIAPVTAIRGNSDQASWARNFPDREVVSLAGLNFYIIHDLKTLDLDPKAAGFAAVVSGHSHMPKHERKDGVLYFNPGSAGPRRFVSPITIGKLKIEHGKVRPSILELKIHPGR